MSGQWKAIAGDVARRILATFLASSLGILGGASVVGGIPLWKAAALAGFVACAQVLERLARASMDGDLTLEEINEAFLGPRAQRGNNGD